MERRDAYLLAAVVALAAAAGVAAAWAPLVLLAPFAIAAVLMLRYPLGRLLWLVLGGMIVLQSSAGISPPKLLYLVGVLVSVPIAWNRLAAIRREPWMAPFRRVFAGTWLLAAFIVVWALVGLRQGATATDVARDGLTYALMLVGPLLAVDAAASTRAITVDRLIVGISLLATIGWAVTWIGRRGVGTVEVNQFLLASNALMAVGMALAVVRGTAGERMRWGWLLLPPVILAGQLVTGTRTGLLLLLALFGAVGSRRRGRGSVGRVLGALLALAAVAAVLLPYLSGRFLESGFLQKRFEGAIQALSGGWSSDQSGSIRLAATEIANRIWNAHPAAGVGFGAWFPDPNRPGESTRYVLDTPSIYLAKFGLLGALLLAVALALVLSVAMTARRIAGRHLPEQAVVRAWLAVMLGLLLLIPPTEDKGFALTIPLLLLLVAVAMREGDASTEDAPPVERERLFGQAVTSSRVK